MQHPAQACQGIQYVLTGSGTRAATAFSKHQHTTSRLVWAATRNSREIQPSAGQYAGFQYLGYIQSMAKRLATEAQGIDDLAAVS